ncbi:MAG: hypothetical protein IKR22_00845 [Clostridiales bacterium]|nr:hypothetical protein [Clostridiales bacterium]
MKYVLVSLTESSKIDFSGAEKLLKTDHLVFLYVKGKKTLSAAIKEALEDVKAEIEYVEIASSSELIPMMAFLIGYHAGLKHEVIVITEDKSKFPSKVAKEAKVLGSFRSVSGSSAGTSSAKKTTAKKSTTTTKASTTKKASTAKKSSTAKKTTTKKTAASKKKDDGLDVSDIFDTIVKKLF